MFWCRRCHNVCLPTAYRCGLCGAATPAVRRISILLACFGVSLLIMWLTVQLL